jgi:hypothetical protein
MTMVALNLSGSKLSRDIEGENFELLVPIWMKALAGLDRVAIDVGLAAIGKISDNYERNQCQQAVKFAQLCKGSTKPYHKIYEALPRPRANKAVQVGQLAKMREILAKTAE